MARCPLCEHEQALGDACDVCGRALGGAGVGLAAAAAGPPPEGLERTGHAGGPYPAAPVEALLDLERTGAAAAPAALRGPPEAWLEATGAPAVEIAVEPLDVERTGGDGAREPASPGGLRRCRYCGELVPEGEAFCLRCAMHVEGRAAAPPEDGPLVEMRCRSCGTPAAGARCPACGARLPAPDGG